MFIVFHLISRLCNVLLLVKPFCKLSLYSVYSLFHENDKFYIIIQSINLISRCTIFFHIGIQCTVPSRSALPAEVKKTNKNKTFQASITQLFIMQHQDSLFAVSYSFCVSFSGMIYTGIQVERAKESIVLLFEVF